MNRRTSSQLIASLLSFVLFSACNVETARLDLQDYDINFNRKDALYTNSETYKVDWSTFGKLRSDQALTQFQAWHKLEIFKNGDCTGEPDQLVDITNVSETNYEIDPAENQTVYSVRVRYGNSIGTETEKCSFPIVIDRDKPNMIAFDYPALDHYIGQKNFLLKFQEGSDVGISGLKDKPYKVMLYSQPQCQGSLVETVETNSTEVEFTNLVNGTFYSVGVVVTDKSGNSTEISCSKHIEIDTNVPTLAISDPSSALGFTRISNPVLTFGNDSTASYWCVTEDIDFVPTNIGDTCPAGQGTQNGWFTSRPPTINLSAGNGTKKFKAWIARSDGNMSSGRYAYAETIFDSVPPGNFAPIGIAGGESLIYDEWLNSLLDPVYRWDSSTDAVDYTIIVTDSSNVEICRYEEVPGADTEIVLKPDDCTFVEGETYSIDITAYDRARNPTVGAPDFSFTVDLTPPTIFSITGVDGGSDVKIDSWFGTTLPTVHYTNPDGEDFFNISIRTAADEALCTNETEIRDILTHDYAASAGNICVAPVSGDTYTVHVSAEDYANNITPATNTSFSARADLDPPEATITSGPDALTPITSAQLDFSISDPLSGIDTIVCRLNGSAWESCAASKQYLNLAQNDYLFEVQATDDVGNVTLIDYQWSVDTENPVLTINSQPPVYTNQLESTISFSATDTYGINHFECSLNGAAWANCTSPWTQTLTDGDYQLDVKAIDNVGHTHQQSAIWRIDTVDPVLGPINAGPSTPGDDTTITVTFDPTDDQSIGGAECQLDNGEFVACTPPFSQELLPAGDHTITVRLTDSAGNQVTDSVSWTIHEYTFQLADSTSVEGFTRTPNPRVTTQYDTAAAFWCFTEDASFTPTSASSVCPEGAGSSNGWYNSRPSAIPLSAGESEKTVYGWIAKSDGVLARANPGTYSIIYDATPAGDFSILGMAGGTSTLYDTWLNSLTEPKLQWEPSTEAIKYSIQVRNSSNAPVCSYTELAPGSQLKELENGDCTFVEGQTYKVLVTSYDRALNEKNSAPAFEFTVDTTAPAPFTISGVDGGADLTVDTWFGTTPPQVHWTNPAGEDFFEVALTTTSNAPVCSLETKNQNILLHDYQAGGSCSGITNGASYKVKVVAEDLAANRRAASNNDLEVRADLQDPVTAITSAPAALTASTTANFAMTSFDALSGLRQTNCRLNTGAWTTCTTSQQYTGLTQGDYTFTYLATDNVGNTSQKTHTWSVDTVAPVLTMSSVPASLSRDTTPTATFSATDAYGLNRYECRLNSGGWNTCSSPWTQSLSDGLYTLQVRAIDRVGHPSAVASTSWRIDTVAPSLTITSAPAASTYDASTAQVYFSAADAFGLSSLQCSFNGGGYTNCSSPYTRSGLGAGNYSVTVRAIDNAGNQTTRTTSWTNYTHSWVTAGWGACSAAQPNWSVGGWYGCTAQQPAFTYGGWGGCSASCGGGVRYRSQYCPVSNGTQYRSVSCPTTYGSQTRGVYCRRSNGTNVADSFCSGAGAKPATSQSCSRNDCSGGTPSSTMACSRGGGSDCHSAQATSQSCNTQSCMPSCGSMTADRMCTTGGTMIFYVDGTTSASCKTLCESNAGVSCCVRWGQGDRRCWGWSAPSTGTQPATLSNMSATTCY